MLFSPDDDLLWVLPLQVFPILFPVSPSCLFWNDRLVRLLPSPRRPPQFRVVWLPPLSFCTNDSCGSLNWNSSSFPEVFPRHDVFRSLSPPRRPPMCHNGNFRAIPSLKEASRPPSPRTPPFKLMDDKVYFLHWKIGPVHSNPFSPSPSTDRGILVPLRVERIPPRISLQ